VCPIIPSHHTTDRSNLFWTFATGSLFTITLSQSTRHTPLVYHQNRLHAV
jgi:hypothetical protein